MKKSKNRLRANHWKNRFLAFVIWVEFWVHFCLQKIFTYRAAQKICVFMTLFCQISQNCVFNSSKTCPKLKKSSQGGVRFHNLRLYSTKPGTTQSLNYQNHQICQAPRHKNFWKTGFFWYCTTDVSIGHKSIGSIWKFVRNMKFTNFRIRKDFSKSFFIYPKFFTYRAAQK